MSKDKKEIEELSVEEAVKILINKVDKNKEEFLLRNTKGNPKPVLHLEISNGKTNYIKNSDANSTAQVLISDDIDWSTIKIIDLAGVDLSGEDLFKVLLEKIKLATQLEILNLGQAEPRLGCSLAPDRLCAILSAVSSFKTISKLDISSNVTLRNMNADDKERVKFMETLCDFLKENNQLEEFHAGFTGLTSGDIKQIQSALMKNTALKVLNFSWNGLGSESKENLGDGGLKELAELIKEGNSRLEYLNLARCGITERSLETLTSMVAHENCHLKKLRLVHTEKCFHADNKNNADRVKAFFNAVADSKSLYHLELSQPPGKQNLQMGKGMVKYVINLIKKKPSLRLHVDYNGFNTEGMNAYVLELCKLLESPDCEIKMVSLVRAQLNSEVVERLARALVVNKSITKVIAHAELLVALAEKMSKQKLETLTGQTSTELQNNQGGEERDNQVDDDERDIRGKTEYLKAAERGDLEKMKQLVSDNKRRINQRNNSGYGAYTSAANKGHQHVMQWLLENDYVQPNESTRVGNTAYLLAAMRGRLGLLKWMASIEYKGKKLINPTECQKHGSDAYMVAASTSRMHASGTAQIRVMKWLLAEGLAQLNRRNQSGWSAPDLFNNHVPRLLTNLGVSLCGYGAGTLNINSICNYKEDLFRVQLHYQTLSMLIGCKSIESLCENKFQQHYRAWLSEFSSIEQLGLLLKVFDCERKAGLQSLSDFLSGKKQPVEGSIQQAVVNLYTKAMLAKLHDLFGSKLKSLLEKIKDETQDVTLTARREKLQGIVKAFDCEKLQRTRMIYHYRKNDTGFYEKQRRTLSGSFTGVLYIGDELYSQDKRFRMRVIAEGNLVIEQQVGTSDAYKKTWQALEKNMGEGFDYFCGLGGDGNLCFYAGKGLPIQWCSGANVKGHSYDYKLSDQGHIEIFQGKGKARKLSWTSRSELRQWVKLYDGQAIFSPNRRFKFEVDKEGALVLSETKTRHVRALKPIWRSSAIKRNGLGRYFMMLKPKGKTLVHYREVPGVKDNVLLGVSEVFGDEGDSYTLKLTDEGKLEILQKKNNQPSVEVLGDLRELYTGFFKMEANDVLDSAKKNYRLRLVPEGNLVIEQKTDSAYKQVRNVLPQNVGEGKRYTFYRHGGSKFILVSSLDGKNKHEWTHVCETEGKLYGLQVTNTGELDFQVVENGENKAKQLASISEVSDTNENGNKGGLLNVKDVENGKKDVSEKTSKISRDFGRYFNAQELWGKHPNQKEGIGFSEHLVDGDGNCGFTALGVTREQFVTELLKLKGDINARKAVAIEILNEFKAYWETRNEQGLSQEGIRPFDPKKWEEAYDRDDPISYCSSPEVFERYIQLYRNVGENKLWMGIPAMLLYAKKKNISVYVWEKINKKDENDRELRCKQCHEADGNRSDVFHILHTGPGKALNHFNLLVEEDRSPQNIMENVLDSEKLKQKVMANHPSVSRHSDQHISEKTEKNNKQNVKVISEKTGNQSQTPSVRLLNLGQHKKEDIAKVIETTWTRMLNSGQSKLDRSQYGEFNRLNGHKSKRLEMLKILENRYGVVLYDEGLQDSASIQRLAKHIEDKVNARSPLTTWVVNRNHSSKTLPGSLFLIHPIMGGVAQYREMASKLHQRILREMNLSLHIFESPILKVKDLNDATFKKNYLEHYFTLAGQAKIAIKAMRAVQPHGPYYLLGWSYGGALTLEIARQLAEQNEDIQYVGLVDTQMPETLRGLSPEDLLKRISHHVNYISKVRLGLNLPDGLIDQNSILFPVNSDELISKYNGLLAMYSDEDFNREDFIQSVFDFAHTKLEKYKGQKAYDRLMKNLYILRANYVAMYRYDTKKEFEDSKLSSVVVYRATEKRSELGNRHEYRASDLHHVAQSMPFEPVVHRTHHFNIVTEYQFTNWMSRHLKDVREIILTDKMWRELVKHYQTDHFNLLNFLYDDNVRYAVSECEFKLTSDNSILVEDLFNRLNASRNKKQHVLLRGEAGIGKSTFLNQCVVKHMMSRPEHPFWPGKKWVFKINLKEVLNHLDEKKHAIEGENAISALLYHLIFKYNGLSYDVVKRGWDYIRKEQTGTVCFILDGVDEVIDLQSSAKHKMDALLKTVLLSDFSVIVSTRDYQLSALKNLGLSPAIEYRIDRFDSDATKRYISNYFEKSGQNALGNKLIALIGNSGPLVEFSKLPMHLNLLCSIWSHYNKLIHVNEIKTITIKSLLDHCVENVFRRFLLREVLTLEDLNVSDDEALRTLTANVARFLERVAYETFRVGATLISPKVRDQLLIPHLGKQPNLLRNVLLSGFLVYEKALSARHDRDRYYQFNSPVIQVYFGSRLFVGRLLATQPLSEKEKGEMLEFLSRLIGRAHYQLLQEFIFNPLLDVANDKPRGLERLLDLLNDKKFNTLNLNHVQGSALILEHAYKLKSMFKGYGKLYRKVGPLLACFRRGSRYSEDYGLKNKHDGFALGSDTLKRYKQVLHGLESLCPNLYKKAISEFDQPKSTEGEGVLHYAVRANNKVLLRFLISLGADIDKESRAGTPLKLASRLNYSECVLILKRLRRTQVFEYLSRVMQPQQLQIQGSDADLTVRLGLQRVLDTALPNGVNDKVESLRNKSAEVLMGQWAKGTDDIVMRELNVFKRAYAGRDQGGRNTQARRKGLILEQLLTGDLKTVFCGQRCDQSAVIVSLLEQGKLNSQKVVLKALVAYWMHLSENSGESGECALAFNKIYTTFRSIRRQMEQEDKIVFNQDLSILKSAVSKIILDWSSQSDSSSLSSSLRDFFTKAISRFVRQDNSKQQNVVELFNESKLEILNYLIAQYRRERKERPEDYMKFGANKVIHHFLKTHIFIGALKARNTSQVIELLLEGWPLRHQNTLFGVLERILQGEQPLQLANNLRGGPLQANPGQRHPQPNVPQNQGEPRERQDVQQVQPESP